VSRFAPSIASGATLIQASSSSILPTASTVAPVGDPCPVDAILPEDEVPADGPRTESRLLRTIGYRSTDPHARNRLVAPRGLADGEWQESSQYRRWLTFSTTVSGIQSPFAARDDGEGTIETREKWPHHYKTAGQWTIAATAPWRGDHRVACRIDQLSGACNHLPPAGLTTVAVRTGRIAVRVPGLYRLSVLIRRTRVW